MAATGVELEQEGIESEQLRHHHHAAIAVLDVGGMNEGVHQETFVLTRICRFLPLIFLPASRCPKSGSRWSASTWKRAR